MSEILIYRVIKKNTFYIFTKEEHKLILQVFLLLQIVAYQIQIG